MLDVYVAPLLLLGLGIAMIVLTFMLPIPKAADLSSVSGLLESYYHQQTGRGRDDYTTIVVLEDGTRFWTNAVTKDTAARVFAERGVEVRMYYEPRSNDVPLAGAIKSYGLWVNGQQIESLESSLAREKSIVHFWFPAVAIFSITVAILIYRRNKRKHGSFRVPGGQQALGADSP